MFFLIDIFRGFFIAFIIKFKFKLLGDKFKLTFAGIEIVFGSLKQ